jgi:CubicO group peptidase (beta-lactamase class C family)
VTRQISTGRPEDYGYGWWVSTSDDMGGYYTASGRGGQRVEVLPALNVIVVTTGNGLEPGDLGLMRPH